MQPASLALLPSDSKTERRISTMKRFRSEREQGTYMACLFALFFVIVVFPIIFEYSTAMGLAIHLVLPAASLVAMLVWERWGRAKFPLKGNKTSP